MMSNNRKHVKPTRPLVIYNTPGQECQHADKGACPNCMDATTRFLRFTSRQVMPAAR